MTETDFRPFILPGRSFRTGLFVLHELTALLVPFILSGILGHAANLMPQFEAYSTLVIMWSLGFSLGLLCGIAFSDLSSEGRWVWILPLSSLVLGLSFDLRNHTFAQLFQSYFTSSKQGAEPGFGLYLITFPAWSCCCYS